MGLHQAELQKKVPVEEGEVVSQQVPEEPLRIPVIVRHSRLTQDTNEGVGRVSGPSRILRQIIFKDNYNIQKHYHIWFLTLLSPLDLFSKL
jgi:hypothetical protein